MDVTVQSQTSEPKTITTLKEWLEVMVSFRKGFGAPSANSKFKYCCLEEFVLKHGRAFPKYLPKPRWVRKGIIKQCFCNCFKAVTANPDKLIYCEGFATSLIATNHAWLMTKDTGEVIDPTWHGRECKGEGKTEYYGIPFKFEYVIGVAAKRGYYGILDNWEQGFPLLRDEHKPEDFLHEFKS